MYMSFCLSIEKWEMKLSQRAGIRVRVLIYVIEKCGVRVFMLSRPCLAWAGAGTSCRPW